MLALCFLSIFKKCNDQDYQDTSVIEKEFSLQFLWAENQYSWVDLGIFKLLLFIAKLLHTAWLTSRSL